MKKTTLISTLAMVVIVALALTTATFAWYTSNSSVTATTQATAATATGSNISIKAGTSAGTESTAALGNTTAMKPLVVNTKPITQAAASTDSSTATALSAFTMWGGFTTSDADADKKWTSIYEASATDAAADSATGYKKGFVTVKNLSTSSTDEATIDLSVNWAALNVDLTGTALTDEVKNDETQANAKKAEVIKALRIAIFEGGDDTATLVSILGSETTQYAHYGTKPTGIDSTTTTVQTVAAAQDVACVTGIDGLCTLKGGSTVADTTKTFGYVIYFDGVMLGQDLSGASITNIVLTFAA